MAPSTDAAESPLASLSSRLHIAWVGTEKGREEATATTTRPHLSLRDVECGADDMGGAIRRSGTGASFKRQPRRNGASSASTSSLELRLLAEVFHLCGHQPLLPPLPFY
ncbi:hypothetical protein GOBAR_AA31335 [Gossypium barbadense]|uniref:Uncharacterized protein n=1 Tax=Gossypium barbadense TaxID=3634 RepID=A0A2P5WE27_GOSBA|nr:hypothetical protein GOBAR_AA31335 [Gossypium barbadense]